MEKKSQVFTITSFFKPACSATQPTTQSTRRAPPTVSASQPRVPQTASASQPLVPQTASASQSPSMTSATLLLSNDISNQPTLPSRSTVSDLLISRDMSTMKDEIRQLKSEIASMRNLPPANSPSDYHLEIGRELSKLKSEVSILREKANFLSTTSSQEPYSPPSNPANQDPHTSSDRIKITAWNCRGLANAYPYLNHLMSDGSDVIILSEHWLWPFHLDQLQDIHPDYAGFGFAEKRLNEKSQLTKAVVGWASFGKVPS